MRTGLLLLFYLFFVGWGICQKNTSARIHLDLSVKGEPIDSSMWGIFFEDINFAADGGLYAELVKNRSFQFPSPLMGWNLALKGHSALLVENRSAEDPGNPRFVHITLNGASDSLELTNGGFRGMGLVKDSAYCLSLRVRVNSSSSSSVRVSLLGHNGLKLAEKQLYLPKQDTGTWITLRDTLVPSTEASDGSLNLCFSGSGMIDLNYVSLFPKSTWLLRPGGLRRDLTEWLYKLHPGFMRFPGGCIVEGRDLLNRYEWKKTVGPVFERKTLMNRWNVEIPKRSTPDYFQSFGLGFFEYFQLCEDIGASPLPVLNCGMACQYNTAEVVSMDELQPFVQDALDLIEFANGDTTTPWGHLRSVMGHPAPFHLKMMGIGNEQWGPQYVARYKIFEAALKASHPEIRIVGSVGPSPAGAEFQRMNKAMRALHPDLLDEHYYAGPEWFLSHARRYDSYDRQGPKIFAGEYASQSDHIGSSENRNDWQGALAEAAFMTGLERNAAVVHMSSYAPLFAHRDAWQWKPDLIWFDNLRSVATVNYYVQQLFSTNRGDLEYPALDDSGHSLAGEDSMYVCCALDKVSGELILKVVNASVHKTQRSFVLQGRSRFASKGKLTEMSSPDLRTENTLDDPFRMIPKERIVRIPASHVFSLSFSPQSVNIVRVPLQ